MADAIQTALPVRPQPLGAFPLPLGYMLIPAGTDTEDARTAMLAGRLPDEFPPTMRAHEAVLAGDRTAAIAALTAPELESDPVVRYNRFVLDPDRVDIGQLRGELGEFAVLIDVVLYALGHTNAPPQADDGNRELAAVVLSARAAHAMSADDPAGALELLDSAVAAARPVSGPLAGVLLGASAMVCRDWAGTDAIARLERAVTLLAGADGLRLGRAEIHLCLAELLHEHAELGKAIPHYHSALQLVLREEAPLVWAAAHAGLGAAYLTAPMIEASDQLRLGVAAQSLRSALKVYTKDEHPQHWASVQLNLANSLVYTPSRHQAENLVEAVERYEELLETRDRADDPLGRARVLANQGNAMAHLGMFDEATAKLYEARFLFEELQDNDSVRTVRGVLDEIARERTLARAGRAEAP